MVFGSLDGRRWRFKLFKLQKEMNEIESMTLYGVVLDLSHGERQTFFLYFGACPEGFPRSNAGPLIISINVWWQVGQIWGQFGPRGRGPDGQNCQFGWWRSVPGSDKRFANILRSGPCSDEASWHSGIFFFWLLVAELGVRDVCGSNPAHGKFLYKNFLPTSNWKKQRMNSKKKSKGLGHVASTLTIMIDYYTEVTEHTFQVLYLLPYK